MFAYPSAAELLLRSQACAPSKDTGESEGRSTGNQENMPLASFNVVKDSSSGFTELELTHLSSSAPTGSLAHINTHAHAHSYMSVCVCVRGK